MKSLKTFIAQIVIRVRWYLKQKYHMKVFSLRMISLKFILKIICVFIFFSLLFNSCFNYLHQFLKADNNLDIKDFLRVAMKLTHNAGLEIVKIRQNKKLFRKVKGKTKEGMEELLTLADLTSNKILTTGFKKEYPYLSLVSEEHEDDSKIKLKKEDPYYKENPAYFMIDQIGNDKKNIFPISDLTVWIDPLDATQEYSENLTDFVTVMVCLVYKQTPILGLIHQPFTNHTYWAFQKGYGYYFSWQVVPKSPEEYKIIFSRSHAGKVKSISKLINYRANLIPAGGSGYKVIQLLESKASLYLHSTNIKKWDICAGDAILKITGGKMTDWDGKKIVYDKDPLHSGGIVATARHLDDPDFDSNHENVLDKLKNINK